MNTCGTCKFWGSDDPRHNDEIPEGEYRTCNAVIHDKLGATDSNRDGVDTYVADYYDKHEFAEAKAEIAAVRKHLAVVKDGSGYYAALKTKDDFGCVLHQPKEQPRE